MQALKSIITTVLTVIIVLLSGIVSWLEDDPLWMDS